MPRISARFDNRLLQAPPFAVAEAEADGVCDANAATVGRASATSPTKPASPTSPTCTDAAALQSSLLALCQGAPGFASASHPLAATPELRAPQRLWLQHRLLELDGTLHMQSLGGPARQLLHRVALKLRETVFPGSTAVSAWDCGLLRTTQAGLQQAEQFMPRRPTLMVAWNPPAGSAAAFSAALQTRQRRWAHPVRLWLLQAPTSG